MSLESEIFKWRKVLPERLISYGFLQKDGVYSLARPLTAGFSVRLFYDGETFNGKVYDDDLEEEYPNFRLEDATGAFVTGIRHAYAAFLEDVRDHCSEARLFLTEQSVRLAERIRLLYGVEPEFLWSKFPHYGVFREPRGGKWFGIIMNIDRGKVSKGESGESDVLNVKLDEEAPAYLQKGAYSCFHMDHKYWVSLILDDRLSDDLVFEMIEKSYRNAEKAGEKGRKAKKP